MKKLNLLEGRIVPLLIKLTLPIIGTSFLEMAYALIDMLWIGKLGASSIAAVGVAGMFSWLSQGLAMIATQGGQVKTGHSRRSDSFATKRNLVEILRFTLFSRHVVFDGEGDKLRNKRIENHITVSVVIDMECGNTKN